MKPDKKLVAEDILKTLPVGYYLGSRAEVVLDEESPTSFVNMMTKEIHVAYKNIEAAMAVVPDDADAVEVENAIRCFLYHETAHLMLTPMVKMNREQGLLEDERIETLLRDTFHGVDFKRNVYRSNEWSPEKEPESFGEFFGMLVRLRIGPEELLKKLDELIANHAESYAGLGREAEEECEDCVRDLIRDYNEFIAECKNEWEKPKEDTPPPPPPKGSEDAPPPPDESDSPDDKEGGGDGEAGDTPPPEEDGGKGGAGEPDDDESEGSSPSDSHPSEDSSDGESSDGGESDGDEGENPDGGGSSGSSPSGEDGGGGGSRDGHSAATDAADKASKKVKAPTISEKNLDKAKAMIAKMLKRFTDSKTSSGMRRIIIRACNRKAARSGVENGYSGRIDPKSVWRPDYRWLMKSGDSGTGKDRLHLRLWVDVSGSFSRSQNAINKLISTLLDLEKEMPSKFSLAVIEMGGVDSYEYYHDPNANRVHDKTKEIKCCEGNDFGPSIGACDIATRRPGWRTMNIVVWDGWALRPHMFDSETKKKRIEHLMEHYPEACSALNNRQTIIISDPSNKMMISKGMPLARTTYVDDEYAKRFTEEVIRQLEYAI